MDNNIFISYSWKNESAVNQIDESFLKDGVSLIRDKRDTKYKDSFKVFMKKIRNTDSVLMVISDDYLKSRNCMYEVLEVLKDESFKERIFPIVLSDAKIYSSTERLEYLDYWRKEYDKLKEKISNFPPEEVISVTEDLKVLRNINISIVDFISIVSDFKNIPFNELKQNNFLEIKQKLGLKIKISKNIKYDIFRQEDISHAGAKRYSAQILIDSKYSRDDIKTVIVQITEKLRNSTYYKNKKIEKLFKDKKADVVWLFIANRLSDINNSNWICRTSWINPNLKESMKPLGLKGNDSIGEIEIDWNEKYQELSDFYDGFISEKDKFISMVDDLLKRNDALIKPLMNLFISNSKNGANNNELIDYVASNTAKMDKIYSEGNDMPIPPHDCNELDKLTQAYFAHSHNLFLYYSKKGLETWKEQNRKYLMNDDINEIQKLEKEIISERKNV